VSGYVYVLNAFSISFWNFSNGVVLAISKGQKQLPNCLKIAEALI
jgi:hypothetical protein